MKMDIIHAIEKANTKQGIRRSRWNEIKIVPTNSDKCCLVFKGEKLLAARWNPNKDDLIADDWKLA